MAATTVPRNRLPRQVAPPVDTPPIPQERNFVDFCKCIRARNADRLQDIYDSRYVSWQVSKASLDETSGGVGGYLVPPDFSARFFRDFSEASIIYPRADVVRMSTLEQRLPIPNVTTAPASGVPPWYGGMSFSWSNANAFAETEPAVNETSLKSWSLVGYAVQSNQFWSDLSPDGEERLLKLFAAAAAWKTEWSFLQGTGADGQMPLGILNAPGTLLVTRKTSNQVNTQDVANMAGSLLPSGWKNAIWCCSPTALKQIVQLSTSYFINDGGGGRDDGSAGTLITRPLFVTDKLPALGSTGDLIFFDPTLYAIGDRMQVAIDISDQTTGFASAQVNVRIWLRLDGKPIFGNTMTLSDTTTSVAGYVALH
jgi:HK97 family phage major capsid protein